MHIEYFFVERSIIRIPHQINTLTAPICELAYELHLDKLTY